MYTTLTKKELVPMKGKYVENLAIIVTEKCNLDCGHCLRGKKSNKSITKDVVDAIFEEIKAVDILNICGGEPTLALDEIEYIFKTIINKRIFLRDVFITINGTIYSERFMSLLKLIDTYIKGIDPAGKAMIGVSQDKYHLEEMRIRNLEYDKRNFASPFFETMRILDGTHKLFNEGNARNLDKSITKPFKPMKIVILKLGNKSKYLSHLIGPLVTINMDGTITEDNTTLENQSTIYNYGNIKTDDLVECLLAHGAIKTSSRFFYNYKSEREKRIFLTYE